MVQLLNDPAVTANDPLLARQGSAADSGGGNTSSSSSATHQDGSPVFSREEHAQRAKELQQKRNMMKAPKRGFSMTDYQGGGHEGSPTVHHYQYHHSHNHNHNHHHHHHLHQPGFSPIPENLPLASPFIPSPAAPSTPLSELQTPPLSSTQSQQQHLQTTTTTTTTTTTIPQRPKLPTPRRSYSVMDYEPPPPNQPRPPTHFTILDMPSEIHYTLFDFLDPIDGVCLGLAHSRLYAIHRRKHGTVPLSSRYEGPNDMEWAWRGVGPLVRQDPSPTQQQQQQQQMDLDKLRVKGQVYCRKCGVSRCELHRHLRDWMGAAYEYCEIRKAYGPPAGEEAKSYCYMNSPKNPHRCGRHGRRKPVAVH